ncbi:PhzF family phenazine biosynthesis protein [Thalassobaculum sp.]|uniref:PhzF family phenazine biosynthesis protein n=1 Tax=Thalassobaculum sp. TaxID=2022740 RepID=UPI0032ED76C6
MALTYETVDVFTETAFGGNPLAVVFGGEHLSTGAMQTIAREFNFPETTFVLPPADPANTAKVRIFTPGVELPFAGHPNVGTATVLARRGNVFGKPVGDTVAFEEAIGLVGLEIVRESGAAVGAVLTAPTLPTVEGTFDPSAVAAAVGLADSAIILARHAPAHVVIGATFVIAEVADLDALAAARSDEGLIAKHLGKPAPDEIYLYTRLDAGDGTLHIRSRMFAPGLGIPEDPATGGAAVAIAGLFVKLMDGDLDLTIEQGVEMGRPSRLDVRILRNGPDTRITVAGRRVPMMRGELVA